MATIIGLTDKQGRKIMVNADQISHFCKPADTPLTRINMVGGETVHVREDVYEIAYRIAPDPADIEPPDDSDNDIVKVTNRIIDGSLTPGQRVEIQSTVEYDDGQVRINRITGTFVGTKPSDFPGNEGVNFHYFNNGTLNGQPHASFGLPEDHFL